LLYVLYLSIDLLIAFSALTLLVGHQQEHLVCKNWVMMCWHGYLSVARCRWLYVVQLMTLHLLLH